MEKYLPDIKETPLIEKVNMPCSIEQLFLNFSDSANTSLLNSSLETGGGRYSFIGMEPFLVLKNGCEGEPFERLRSILDKYKVNNPTSLPFIAGGIGYFSYDLKDVLEKLPQKAKDDLRLPGMYFVFYRALLIHDKFEPKSLYISILDDGTGGLMKKIIETINKTPRETNQKTKRYAPTFTSNFSKTDYIKAIQKVMDYIRAGDIYQACLSQRFKTEWPFDPYSLYLNLDKINPAPYSSYLNFEDLKIISSSPELFLKISEGTVETRPMKGTFPRGKNTEEDEILKKRLEGSSKDAAELSMIVDLERNDLGKFCSPGSVRVDEHRVIETYPTVFQTISIIKGEMGPKTDLIDAVKAVFPGGSITGCPKIRAMEIIDELEPTRRNVYTGAIGYISFHDTMLLNIAIRTILMKEKDVYFQVGSGIVADSDPEAEYRETLDKARALMESLKA